MGPCATTEELERFLADRSGGPAFEALAAHIDVCLTCQQALECMTASPIPSELGTRALEDEAPTALLLRRIEARGPDRSQGAAPEDGVSSARAATDDEPLPSFPGYELVARIGEGGMGVVYKARDVRLGRLVAIKTIAARSLATSRDLDRFRSEAQAVARLNHPNIIALYSIGEHEHGPYLSLEFAEGGSLDRRLADKPTAPREAAELLETLARAVHAAHEAGVVHRDLKPANILLTADGVPKVSDFGLAKLTGDGSALTASKEVVGSPSYMSPEQAEGGAKRVGPGTDVYALGAILYEALTCHPPFRGASALETIKLVASTDVVAPRRFRPASSRSWSLT
jgi:eukaryotic-like serine/threonine-protein kinase